MLRRLGRVLAAFAAVALVWRWAGRRLALPCPAWLAWTLERRGSSAAAERTLDRIGLRPGQRVLEIGPGPGRLLIPAARRVLPGGEVTGLDVQPGMIRRLVTRARDAGVTNLTAVLGDAAGEHFAPAGFDVIYLVAALGEIKDREAALRRAREALRPGGTLSITEVFPDPHFQPQAAVRRLAESAGFRLREIHGSRRAFTANFEKPEA